MLKKRLIIAFCFCYLAACNTPKPQPEQTPLPPTSTAGVIPTTVLPSTSEPLPTTVPLLTLNICLGSEPKSLFLYQASSPVERSVLQAIYDGPVDVRKDGFHAVILTKPPSLPDGDVFLAATDVGPGEPLVAAAGQLTALQEGTSYYPAGCAESSCVQNYVGSQPVAVEQVVIRFSFLPELTWADGNPLTADDSLYSYEVARGLFSQGQYTRLDMTAGYQVLDEQTVEWRGLPGYRDVQPLAYFFSPLPRHRLGKMTVEQLLVDEQSARLPLGWGPYMITEWVTGDHISFSKNPAYFRTAEGLPHFDHLVYRFIKDGDEALDALLTGECDLIDPSAALELEIARLQQLQQEGRLAISFQQDVAWELAVFGIESLNPQRLALFSQPQVRQAVAMCINRQEMASQLMYGQSSVPDTYVPSSHPLHAPDLPQYAYDPQTANELLRSVGWMDSDSDPSTPRIALGVPGVPDGAIFEFTYLVSPDAERQAAAQAFQASLAGCGLRVNLDFQEPADYLAVGPAGPVFGRDFDMAQFGLPVLISPPCQFFTSDEIPGPYPMFSRSWSGMNVSGYRSLTYDSACLSARTSMIDTADYQAAHMQAQMLFAHDLPAIPLYTRFKVMASHPEVCHLSFDLAYNEPLWNLELLDKGDGCQQ